MAPFKEENYLIIQPCSQYTLCLLGINSQDSLSLPSFKIPTRVLYSKSTQSYKPCPSNSIQADDQEIIYPIVKGKIVNLEAFNYFLKVIVDSILKEPTTVTTTTTTNPTDTPGQSDSDPTVSPEQNNASGSATPTPVDTQNDVIMTTTTTTTTTAPSPSSIAMTFVSSVNFSKSQLESVTNFIFEKLEIGALNIIPSCLCASFAYGSLHNSLVIDIGYEKTDISAITDFQNLKHLNLSICKGGQSINETLRELLPSLNTNQIEQLKKSSIFEILNEEDMKNSFFGLESLQNELRSNEEDEGVLDVAAIITSDQDPNEVLQSVAKKSSAASATNSDTNKPNSELEKNSFQDEITGEIVEIGKERFQGSKELIQSISYGIKSITDQIPDLHKRQELFDNIIVVGGTSKIKGFKEALLMQLLQDHVIMIRAKKSASSTEIGGQGHNNAELAFRNETGPASINVTGGNNLNNQLLGLENEIYNVSQVPKFIKYAKLPEYFPVWKKANNTEDVQFLGAQILTKQIYGTGHGNNYGETLFLNRDSYLANGPVGIWTVAL